MTHDRHDDDGDLGEELDLDLVEREAAKVQRRALDIDFGEVLPDAGRSSASAQRHGSSSLDDERFLSKKDQEARERARGGTPTLDRMGKKAPRRVRPDGDGPVLPIDSELVISTKGLPGWAWAAIAVGVFGLLAGGGGFALYSIHQSREARDTAAVEEALERAREREAERLRRLEQDG